MSRFVLYATCLLLSVPSLAQPTFVPNYDESKVGSYTLPDPLQPPGQPRITSARQWMKQRAYWLNQFAENVYGRTPTQPVRLRFETRQTNPKALGGRATSKQVAIHFTDYPKLAPINVLVYVPNQTTRPVPAFLGLNFGGNHTVTTETDIFLADRWVAKGSGGVPDSSRNGELRPTNQSRGKQAAQWPVDTLVARGYALVTAYYGDIEPDYRGGGQLGIRGILSASTPGASTLGASTPGDSTQADNWGSIGAWAWGMSRILDYLQTEPRIDARRVIAIGHSRIGKAAMWAAAQDERFAALVANEAGESGASLSRRTYGETIGRITNNYGYWFANRYRTYANNVPALPVDGHILLSLIAPRPVYVASAEEDRWSDPRGEFLSARAAEPVYALFGKAGLGTSDYPPVNTPIGNTISYHVRTGPHDVKPFDWWQYLRFADKWVK